MVEWQAESSLFTLRVRGKQWYWVYKYELKAVTDVLTAPKNIGNNKWVISNPLDLQVANDYLYIHQLRAQSAWVTQYWNGYKETEIPLHNISTESGFSLMGYDFYKSYIQANANKKFIKTIKPFEQHTLSQDLAGITAFFKNKELTFLEEEIYTGDLAMEEEVEINFKSLFEIKHKLYSAWDKIFWSRIPFTKSKTTTHKLMSTNTIQPMLDPNDFFKNNFVSTKNTYISNMFETHTNYGELRSFDLINTQKPNQIYAQTKSTTNLSNFQIFENLKKLEKSVSTAFDIQNSFRPFKELTEKELSFSKFVLNTPNNKVDPKINIDELFTKIFGTNPFNEKLAFPFLTLEDEPIADISLITMYCDKKAKLNFSNIFFVKDVLTDFEGVEQLIEINKKGLSKKFFDNLIDTPEMENIVKITQKNKKKFITLPHKPLNHKSVAIPMLRMFDEWDFLSTDEQPSQKTQNNSIVFLPKDISDRFNLSKDMLDDLKKNSYYLLPGKFSARKRMPNIDYFNSNLNKTLITNFLEEIKNSEFTLKELNQNPVKDITLNFFSNITNKFSLKNNLSKIPTSNTMFVEFANLKMYDTTLGDVNLNVLEPDDYTDSLSGVIDSATPLQKNHPSMGYGRSESQETSWYAQKGQSIQTPVRLIKYPLNFIKDSLNSDDVELFRLRFGTGYQTVEQRVNTHQTYWIFRQKRYKRVSTLKTRVRYYTDWQNRPTQREYLSYEPYVIKNRLVAADKKSHMTHYEIIKTSRKRNENISLPFNKRLLRTRRIVVLPAHVNISVITNSFDVVHSWFIPGLGIKMDCIPGRSTHHVLNIENVGFYYGQCAEICGRFHHHMPIRICALPFEHFMVWWHSFAMPRLLKTYEEPTTNLNNKKFRYFYSHRKYAW